MHNFSTTDQPKVKRNDATKTNEYETDTSTDTRNKMEANRLATLSGTTNDATGLYTGSNNYSSIIVKNKDSISANKHTGSQGPLRANTFVRTTSRFDYQPDICKDYKNTGFCGFGDTCVFLHDRATGQKGWEIERDWELKVKAKQEEEAKALKKMAGSSGAGGEDGSDDEDGGGAAVGIANKDDIPFACHLCVGQFSDPVITICNHYFCEKCIKSNTGGNTEGKKKDKPTAHKTCPLCKKNLEGIFNFPTKLEARKKKVLKGVDVSGEGWKEYYDVCKKGRD